MALPATILSNYGQSSLDTSVNNAAVGISPAGQFFTLVALGGLGGSGATLTFEGSTDNGANWAAVSATHATSRVSGSAITADGLYKLPTGTRTHFRLRVSSVGGGAVTVGAVGGSTPQDVLSVDASGNPVGGGGGGGGSTTITGPLPTGTNTIGSVNVNGTQTVQGVAGGVPLAVSDPQNAAYTTWPAITASAGPSPPAGTYTVPAGTRNLSANATAAGNISMTDGAGNVKTCPLSIGFQTLPFLPATFTTTATATFWADK